jgi:pyruvate formate lyase activating enzyme
MRCRYCHNPDTWEIGRGDERSAKDVIREALRYRTYWGANGGITVSGGEPMLQLDFVTELFRLAAAEGISCVLDTSGAPFRDDAEYLKKFDALMENCSLVMLDIKHIDPTAHQSLTGRDNGNILAMARRLSDMGKKMWIRYVLVPGINDGDEDVSRCADFISTLKTVERVEVLPYHSMGAPKWRALGYKYTLDDVVPPSAELKDAVQAKLSAALQD